MPFQIRGRIYKLIIFVNRTVHITILTRVFGIDGGLGVPYTTNRHYGGLNTSRRRQRSVASYAWTLKSRPHMTRVS